MQPAVISPILVHLGKFYYNKAIWLPNNLECHLIACTTSLCICVLLQLKSILVTLGISENKQCIWKKIA